MVPIGLISYFITQFSRCSFWFANTFPGHVGGRGGGGGGSAGRVRGGGSAGRVQGGGGEFLYYLVKLKCATTYTYTT